ncbi:hypothetical protein AAMO2058_000838500, partial [Amorphochlora amoebiformis]
IYHLEILRDGQALMVTSEKADSHRLGSITEFYSGSNRLGIRYNRATSTIHYVNRSIGRFGVSESRIRSQIIPGDWDIQICYDGYRRPYTLSQTIQGIVRIESLEVKRTGLRRLIILNKHIQTFDCGRFTGIHPILVEKSNAEALEARSAQDEADLIIRKYPRSFPSIHVKRRYKELLYRARYLSSPVPSLCLLESDNETGQLICFRFNGKHFAEEFSDTISAMASSITTYYVEGELFLAVVSPQKNGKNFENKDVSEKVRETIDSPVAYLEIYKFIKSKRPNNGYKNTEKKAALGANESKVKEGGFDLVTRLARNSINQVHILYLRKLTMIIEYNEESGKTQISKVDVNGGLHLLNIHQWPPGMELMTLRGNNFWAAVGSKNTSSRKSSKNMRTKLQSASMEEMDASKESRRKPSCVHSSCFRLRK